MSSGSFGASGSLICRSELDKKDTVDVLRYEATIEGHRVVALIDQFGLELSRLYIDREFCDIYDPSTITVEG